jgi:D-alanine-D-alanine ligase
MGALFVKGGGLYRAEAPVAFSILERRLEPGEHVFTSMDRRAITADRIRFLDDAPLKESLRRLGTQIYAALGLQALVRIDLRADAEGVLHVLEANPKPDLKRPAEGRASLVALGLSENGMSYDDLVLGLLADRIDSLLTAGLCHAPVLLQALEEVR